MEPDIFKDTSYHATISIRAFRDGYTVDFSGASFSQNTTLLKTHEQVLHLVNYILETAAKGSKP